MRLRFASVLVVAALAMMGVWIAPASAAVRGVSAGDCKALDSIGDLQSSLSQAGSSNRSATVGALTGAAKKVSDKKLKSALLQIATVYKAVSKAKGKLNAAAVAAKYGRRYASALQVFTTAAVSCATSNITTPR